MFRSIFQTCILCFLLFFPVLVNANSFTVNERILTSTSRVNRVQSDFTYSVKITNHDINASSVSATVRSTDSHTIILDDSLNFGAIANEAQGTSTDTFTLRQDRQFPFNPDSLMFEFTAIPENGNTKPVANSGIDQTVSINSLVTLDGTGSSDAEGDPLTYRWSFADRPNGSAAFLTNENQSNPSFTVDKSGQYTVELIVNDGQVDSSPDKVVISTENSAPVAEAGSSQTATAGSTVILDGSNSSDVDGDPLVFNWVFLKRPENSSATLTNATSVKPQFVIDQPGNYKLQLIVNDGKLNSQPDIVSISTQNSAPVAKAGDDFGALVNATVLLDGTESSDADGNSLIYKWSILSRPEGSTTNLSDSSAPISSLLIDYPGSYVIQLIVNDSFVDSVPDTIVISNQNSKPVANAGADQTVFVNDQVGLDGSHSIDVDKNNLTFSWSINSKPPGSSASLVNPNNEKPSITIDHPGTYVIQLIVNDGTVDSLADTVVITTQNSRPVANAGPDESVFIGSKMLLNGGLSFDVDSDPLDYQWSLTSKPSDSNPVFINENTVKPEFTADKPGTYVLQLIVFDGSLPSNPDTLIVDAKVPAVAIQSSATSGSIPLEVSLNAIPSGGFPPYQFEWDLDGNGSIDDTRKNFVYTFLQRGVFEVTLKMKDSKGYEAVAKQTISVNSAPSVIVSASPNSGSAPLSVNFSAIVSDVDGIVNHFDWDFDGDGVIDQSTTSPADVTFFYQKAGLYNAKLTVYDNDGLSNSDTVAISVGSAPQVTATVNNFTGVAPFSVNFSGLVTDNDGQVVLYEWDFDGDKQFDYSSASSADVSHTYTLGGIYNATLRISDNDGLIDEDSLIISVSGPPTSLPGAYPLAGEAPLKVTFFSDGKDLDGGPEFYDWDFDGNGTYDQRLIASQNTTHTYNQSGVYHATLKVVDDDGLAATAFVTITVNESTGTSKGAPVVIAKASPPAGGTPLNAILSGFATDEDGSIVKYEWDFESDGTYDFTEAAAGIGLITETIDVGSYAHQTFADFDGDGDLDMIIGNSNGQITYFRNDGDAKVFEFVNQGLIQNGAGLTIDVGSYAAPYTHDIDGDGDHDLLVGDSNGWVYVLENTGTIKAPVWENNGTLKLAGGANLDVGNYAAPVVYSVGNDSDWDLLVGNSDGILAVYENTDSDSFPVWVDNGDIQDSSGVLIDVGSYASPLLIDHDSDGDRDLYVGENGGRIVYLENQGTDQSPVWINRSYVPDTAGNIIDTGSYATPVVALTSGSSAYDLWAGNSDGQIIWYQQNSNNSPLTWQLKSNPFNSIDVGSYASPARVDYDDNGIWDLVVGNSGGNLQLIRNLGTNDKPIFRADALLVDALGATITVGTYASPAFTDLDNNGDDDLIAGNVDGQLMYYLNTGTAASPQWTPQGLLKSSGGATLDIGSYSSPIFIDYDGDGDQDIVAGNSNGQLYYIQNTGTSNSPLWAIASIINDANNSAIDVGSYSKSLITDINADGVMDLLIGNSNGVIYRYENISHSSLYIWSLKETQMAKANVGSYAAPIAMNLDGDIDEDLLIGNSSGLLYQLKSYGNVAHTYNAEGDHTATLRVTDNSNKTATDQINITSLPTGYPSLALAANVKEGLVPLKVEFVATAKDSDGTIAGYEWDFDGDGIYELTGSAKESYTYTKIGAFNPRVRVTDNDGKQALVSVPLKVNMQINFSHNAVINPESGEKSAISTVLDAEATIKLKVVDELGNIVKTLVDGEFRTAGSYIDSWDGFDALNNQAADGAYYFVLSYSHNGVEGEIDARATADFVEYTPSRTWPSTFNPYTGVPVTSTYTVNKPSEVSFYFWVRDNSRPGSTIAPVRTLFIRELKAAGTHTEVWDGVDDKGVPVKPGEQYPITLWIYELPENAIVITGSKPVINNLSVNNRIFNPAFNPYSTEPNQTVRVQFDISKDSTMDIVAIDSTGLQIDRFTKSGLTTGVNSISWDGRNFKDELVPPGVYSLQLTAIDSKGNRSLPRYAVVTVRY